MANLPETVAFDDGIYQIETTDPVLGGPNGIANAQAKGLTNRTAWLKKQIQDILTGAQVPMNMATQDYVQRIINLLDYKQSVRVATTANITLSGAQTIDGVSVVAGDRVLVKDQTDAKTNGLYTASGTTWSRTTDADDSAEVTSGLEVYVEEGTAQAKTRWQLTNAGSVVIGTTSLTFGDITSGKAPLNSPALSGIPTAPTAGVGTNSDQLATMAALLAGIQATGLLTDASPSISDLNNITKAGAYRYSSGTTNSPSSGQSGVLFHLNYSTAYWGQLAYHIGQSASIGNKLFYRACVNGAIQPWREVVFTDSPALTGTPTATKAPQFATGSQIINADALKAAGLQFSGVRALDLSVANISLALSDVGSLVVFTGSGGGSLTLPKASTVPAGGTITIRAANTVASTNTLKAASGDTLSGCLGGAYSGTVSGYMRSGDSVIAVSDGVSSWYCVAESSYNAISSAVTQQMKSGQSLADNGFRKDPGGLIWQWGVATLSAVQVTNVPFPTTFPTKCLSVVASPGNASSSADTLEMNGEVTTSYFPAVIVSSGSQAPVSGSIKFIAVGY